jgi:hypothetical protein
MSTFQPLSSAEFEALSKQQKLNYLARCLSETYAVIRRLKAYMSELGGDWRQFAGRRLPPPTYH